MEAEDSETKQRLPRNAMLARYAVVVCLSVCMSATCRYCVKMAKLILHVQSPRLTVFFVKIMCME